VKETAIVKPYVFSILAGILPVTRRLLSGLKLSAAWREAKCSHHMFGSLPGATGSLPGNQASDVSRRDQ
jgi:xanthosine utilization system XapX-like protein